MQLEDIQGVATLVETVCQNLFSLANLCCFMVSFYLPGLICFKTSEAYFNETLIKCVVGCSPSAHVNTDQQFCSSCSHLVYACSKWRKVWSILSSILFRRRSISAWLSVTEETVCSNLTLWIVLLTFLHTLECLRNTLASAEVLICRKRKVRASPPPSPALRSGDARKLPASPSLSEMTVWVPCDSLWKMHTYVSFMFSDWMGSLTDSQLTDSISSLLP